MNRPTSLFENMHYCEVCKKPLPLTYEPDICPLCEEQALFHKVKDFIRSRDVNEYQVAEHFNLPIQKVKGWIREGRIQYKDTPGGKVAITMHCQSCGEPISFGTLCPKCIKKKNQSGQYNPLSNSEAGNMRHLGDR